MDKQIDENLRRVYSEALNEPLPDRFTQLLNQLRQKDDSTSGESCEDED